MSRPQEFEPGYGQPPDAQNPHACAPPPTDSVLNFGFPGVYWRVTSLQPPSEACVPCCVTLPLSLWLCLTLSLSLCVCGYVCGCVAVWLCGCVCAVLRSAVPGAAGGAIGGPPPADSFDSFFPPPPGEKGGGGLPPNPMVPSVVIPQAHVVRHTHTLVASPATHLLPPQPCAHTTLLNPCMYRRSTLRRDTSRDHSALFISATHSSYRHLIKRLPRLPLTRLKRLVHRSSDAGGVQAPVVGHVVDGAPPDFDALEARFKAIAGGAPPPPGFSVQPVRTPL